MRFGCRLKTVIAAHFASFSRFLLLLHNFCHQVLFLLVEFPPSLCFVSVCQCQHLFASSSHNCCNSIICWCHSIIHHHYHHQQQQHVMLFTLAAYMISPTGMKHVHITSISILTVVHIDNFHLGLSFWHILVISQLQVCRALTSFVRHQEGNLPSGKTHVNLKSGLKLYVSFVDMLINLFCKNN